ncbi:molecular chaperone DnaJ [Sphingosinicella rhizophila]|uniref:Chaperone protein DnaJ n=1 Tax=Sphingosinicella rhizophila TaxID=3050082 RepID=A0ABU3Q8R6_9SPHN|nr:molecular chaperone DnaJ [Sphingosinicella sp. GR2756]MDT9599776.1 molecular chaperone DnaJ [Sphingosinicella sp. GR2756]
MFDADYYELLQIERTADERTIKTAYRRLAMECHPDRNPGCKDSEARFKAISAAYDCLKDPQKRAAYDRFGHAAFQNGGMGGGGAQDFGSFSDIFENIFGEFMNSGQGDRRSNALRGSDLRYDLEISLEDAYQGKQIDLRIDTSVRCEPCDGTGAKAGTSARRCTMCDGRGQVRASQGFFVVERTCPTCRGLGEVIADPCDQCRGEGRAEKQRSLEVRIPAGVDEGTRIRLSGEGEAGVRGGPSGDLYIFIHLARHALFQRDGTTLFTRCPISFTTAALGGAIEVPGLDRQMHEIRIPAGIQSGKQLRQRGAGMPVLNGRGHGDLVIQVEVETPTKLSARQKELLEEFRTTETGEECPASSTFFNKLKTVWEGLTD